MSPKVELLLEEREEGLVLCSPLVGTFTCALDPGRVCTPGMDAGVIRTLGRATSLLVPEGVFARVTSARPERVHHPVGYGDVLYELSPVEGVTAAAAGVSRAAAEAGSKALFRSPHSGRFWHKSAPDEPPLVEPGTVVEEGQPVGLIEVMKTFGRISYHAAGSLPARARVVRLVAADGAEVSSGDPLLEVEEA